MFIYFINTSPLHFFIDKLHKLLYLDIYLFLPNKVIFRIRLHWIANDRSELSNIVMRSPSAKKYVVLRIAGFLMSLSTDAHKRSFPALHTFIFVLYGNIISATELATENPLHHQHKFIICDILVVNGYTSDVISKGNLDNQLATQIKLIERALWPSSTCHFHLVMSVNINSSLVLNDYS